ncbi:CIC11C00000000893 [Sungouiella intermedia]|uniref:CIC11C00000000893 n=1 Tax=Sungouiella intermedia TaxID=45354 RepID=A0A1L0DWK3_9ASCO|nr:CIC11C00000000893 [[Candida] intermedia]
MKLNSGYDMPQIGYGTWKIPKDICAEKVYNAVKAGYRLFDGAQDYANEKEVGDGLKRVIDEGIVKREDLFIVLKLWNSFHHPDNVEAALDRTLSDLKLDYLDLFLIHFPIAFKFVPFEVKYPPGTYCGDGDKIVLEKVPILDTWKTLERLVSSGKIRSIGVSNFNGAVLMDLLSGATIPPAVLQIEHHPYLQQPNLINWTQSNGIVVTAYSSFGPQSFLEMKYPKAENCVPLFAEKTITRIAEKHSVKPSQVLLRWSTQNNIAVIPKGDLPEHLELNMNSTGFDLDDQDLKDIEKLDIGVRFNDAWEWAGVPTFY